jgi:hypothetical protein
MPRRRQTIEVQDGASADSGTIATRGMVEYHRRAFAEGSADWSFQTTLRQHEHQKRNY